MADAQFVTDQRQAVISYHKVLRNTYMLLSLTLLFSSMMAGVAIAIEAPYMGLMSLLVMFGLLFGVHKLKNSVWGIAMVFAFTGFMGFALGPLVNFYLQTAAGTQTVMSAAGLTGIVFLSLSGYVLVSQKDFSYMAGFLMTGLWVVFGSILLLMFGSMFGFYVSGFHLALSAAIVFLMTGLILFDTSRILHGGETNYLLATIALYLDIYLMFTHLMHLIGFFGDD
ncbi:MAG: Bax inhibitor-1 family protein [Gammaproteobacteria bacterium]|nr:Bax inhibitor-1 family protein [Gammaproteobacteria bacterium]